MDLNQLIEARKVKLQELEGVLGKAKEEKREMFTSENEAFNKINTDIEGIDKEIEEKRKINNKTNIIIKKNTMEQFNLLTSIRNIVEGRSHDDATLAVMEAGKKDFAKAGLSYRGQLVLPMEYRGVEAIVAGTQYAGQEVVPEQKMSLLEFLRANSVLVEAGATLLTGLVGDVSIPILSGATATWKSEVAAGVPGSQGFTEKTMTPKRITTYYDVSKQFLLQDSVNANAMLQQDLMASVNDLLEATVLGTANSSATQPLGLFYSPTLVFSGTSTFANMIALESGVAGNNALRNGAKYILHPSSVGKLKGTQKASGTGFVVENSLINGYPYLSTTNLPLVALGGYGTVFGVWSDMVIGQWGGMDLTIDPYSRAIYGQVRIVVNFYVDCITRRADSFAKGVIGT